MKRPLTGTTSCGTAILQRGASPARRRGASKTQRRPGLRSIMQAS